ncbi:MAG TPA: holdfast anchoring protein HfaA [Rhizomicrobium sp.]|nr:holdfast anchoring protein HfaA [Rhizomicrobium sp.]
MTRSRTLLALACLLLAPTSARAGDWTNSAIYNGYGASSQNQASNYSMRDANGNLTLINGQVAPSLVQQSSGAQYATSGAGANTASTYGQANAVGNQLSVVVVGSHNTTVIDSTQINNGNQTASTALNRQ